MAAKYITNKDSTSCAAVCVSAKTTCNGRKVCTPPSAAISCEQPVLGYKNPEDDAAILKLKTPSLTQSV